VSVSVVILPGLMRVKPLSADSALPVWAGTVPEGLCGHVRLTPAMVSAALIRL